MAFLDRTLPWLGLGAGTLLLGVAWSPLLDPDLAGEQELARVSGQIRDGLIEDWQRLLEDPTWLTPLATRHIQCTLADLRAALGPAPPIRDWTRLEAPGETAFDLIFAEAEHREVQDRKIEAAIDLVGQALTRTADQRRRAHALLRRIQLLIKADRPREASQDFATLQQELDGSEAFEGVSILLRAFLAAAPGLAQDELETARARLITLAKEELLALPPPPQAGEWLDYLHHAPGPPPGGGIPPRVRPELRGALASFSLPAIESPLLASQGMEILIGVAVEDRWELWWLNLATWVHDLQLHWQEQRLLPAGFQLTTGGDHALRSVAFGDGLPELSLSHPNPDQWIRTAGRPRLWIRFGMSALALACIAAGLALQRTLARERRLHRLRREFVANVSHELRTPLASILLMAKTLRQATSRKRVPRAITA